MTIVKLISVEPTIDNVWCSASTCFNEVESAVELRIGTVEVKLSLCEDCKIALLKEVE